MRLRALCTAVFTLLALVVVSPCTARAQGSCGNPGSLPNTPPTTAFFEGNKILGPDRVPTEAPVGSFVKGYQRLGDQQKPPMSEAQWKSKFIGKNAKGEDVLTWPDSKAYPDGFDQDGQGKPDRHRFTLKPGTSLDRFGYAQGRFLAPVQASFGSRALPPNSLNTPNPYDPDYEGKVRVANAIIPPSNYHVYCVQNAFDVDAGPIAPWFNQAGKGTQYVVMPGYVPNQPDATNVAWLLTNGPNGPGTSNPYLVEKQP
jgi:Tuberculosis necrotizing toxin